MSSSVKTSIPGSNPSVQIQGSNPAIQVQGSNPALQVQGSNPSMLIQAGNPSFSGLYAVTTKKKSIFLPVFITVLLVITLGMVGAGVFKTTRDIRNAKNEADKQSMSAEKVTHVNAQSTSDLDDYADAPIAEEVAMIDFFLYSTPSKADVYCDGEFISQTPVEHKFVKNETGSAHIVVVQDGYEMKAFDVSLASNYSDSVTLTQIVIEQPRDTKPRPSRPQKPVNAGSMDDIVLPP